MFINEEKNTFCETKFMPKFYKNFENLKNLRFLIFFYLSNIEIEEQENKMLSS